MASYSGRKDTVTFKRFAYLGASLEKVLLNPFEILLGKFVALLLYMESVLQKGIHI